MRKTKFSTPRSSPSRKQSNIHYADLLQKYGAHTNIRPNKQTKNMKINIDSETIDKNLISSIFDTPKPVIEESVIDEQNYKYTKELTFKRSPRLTEDQKTQLFDRLTLPKVITTEIKSPNISPKKKPFSSGKKFNIKFVNSRFFDVPEKISLTQFEIILRYFTIIDHSMNDRPLIQEEIVNPCQIDDDFYDSQKLKQILIDSFEKSTGNPFWSEVAYCIMSSRLNGKMKMYIRCPTSKSNSSKFKSSASSQVNENKLQNKSIQFSDDMSYTTDEEIDGLQRPVYPNIFKNYYKYYYEPPEEEEQKQNNKFEEEEEIVEHQNIKFEEEEIVEQQNIKFEEEEEIFEENQQNIKLEEEEEIVEQQQNNTFEEEEIVEQQQNNTFEEEEIFEENQHNYKFEEEEEIIDDELYKDEKEEIIDDELYEDEKEEEDHIEQFENEEKTIEREVKQISNEEESFKNTTSQKEEEEDKTDKEQPVQKKRKNYPNSNQDPFFQNDEYEYNYYSEEQYVKSNLTFDDLIQEAASQPVEEEEFQSIADETSYSKEFLSYDSIDYNSIDNDEDFYVKVKTRRKGSRHRRSTNSLIQDQNQDNDNDKDKNQSKSKSCVPYHHHHRHRHHHHHKHHDENKEEEEFFDRLKIAQPNKQQEEEFFDRLKIAQPNKQEDNHVESDSTYKESNSKYSSSEVGKYPVTVPIEDVDVNDLNQYEENQ